MASSSAPKSVNLRISSAPFPDYIDQAPPCDRRDTSTPGCERCPPLRCEWVQDTHSRHFGPAHAHGNDGNILLEG
jgi:hypothetical protein